MTLIDIYHELVQAGMDDTQAGILVRAFESRDNTRLDAISTSLHEIRGDIRDLRNDIRTAERWGLGLIATLALAMLGFGAGLVYFVANRVPA